VPGFGAGPFGHQPFGEWKWSRRVFFEYIPELYKQLDADNGGLLELFAESLRPSFDNLRHKIRDMIEMRDPLLVRTQYDVVRRLRLGPVLGVKGTVEQRGVTASVDGLQQFLAPTGRFNVSDVGKDLFVSGSAFQQNNRKVSVVRIVNTTTIITDPLLAPDAGPLRWELRTKVDTPTDRITVEVRSGDISEMTPGWLVFDGFADFTVLTRRQFKVPVDETQFLTEQEGTDGAIDNLGRFMSATVDLDQQDVGKHITIVNSVLPDNNGKAEITKVVVVAPGDVRAELDADPPFVEDANLTWAILPYGEIDFVGTVSPQGIIEQEGVDLTITVSGVSEATVVANSAIFTADDVGKELSLRGSTAIPSNDGIYVVSSFITSSSVNIVQRTPIPLTVETLNLLTWEIRPPTEVGDLTQVDARAPSMIVDLAPDFGIDIDTQESEPRQRSWVKNVSQWIGLKGTHDGYRIIGAISGFDVTTFQLFRVGPALFDTIPDGNEYEVGESAVGRSGTDGTVVQVPSLRYQLTSPTATFFATDVGRQIRIRNAATPSNNKLLTIDSIVSATTVQFAIGDTFSLPDANNGVLEWSVVRLYTDLAPLLPVYDEINNDLLEQIVETESGGSLTYEVDKYCWEDDFDTTVHIDVLSVTTPSPGVQRLSVVGSTDFPVAPEVILKVGRWQFVSLGSPVIGTGDSITGAPPDMQLTDTGHTFTAADVGKWIQITGATTPANNGTFPITDFIGPNDIIYFNGLGVAEAFSGTYQVFSETDYFVESIPALTGALATPPIASGTGDSFAQAGNITTLTDAAALFTASMVGKHILIASATTVGNNGLFVITSFVSATQVKYKNASGATEAFTGTWTVGLGVYTFDLSTAVAPPAPGPAKLRYVCPTVLTCDYCGASKVFALIEATADLLAETGTSVERVLERVLSRMDEVTPAHVELIVRFRTNITASLALTASVETESIDEGIVAPLSAFYDEIDGDEIVADTVLTATIEPTMT